MTPICPHCNIILEKPPKRKKKCPNCGNYIYVRTRQKIFPTIYLTEEQAKCVDWIKRFGISEEEYKQVHKELSKKFGSEPRPSDIIWGVLNNWVIKAGDDYGYLSYIYYLMASFTYDEGKKGYFDLLQLSRKYELLKLKDAGIQKVKILSTKECESCAQLDGEIFTIEEALEKMPIPNRNCTFTFGNEDRKEGFCRCIYVQADY